MTTWLKTESILISGQDESLEPYWFSAGKSTVTGCLGSTLLFVSTY